MDASFSSDDLPPVWLQDYRPLTVDLGTLATFAATLRQELEANFVPHLARILDRLDDGAAPFDATHGFLELAAAQQTYADSRDRAVELLDAYAKGTRALADAAASIAQRYRDSDGFARATLTDVRDAFGRVGLGQADSAGQAGT